MAYVSNLFIAVEHRQPMKAVDQAMAFADRGFEGCIHARPGGKRQLLIVESETLTAFGLAPGILRENITTVGLHTAELKAEQQLVIGNAVLEVTIPCEPCFRMDEIRTGLQEALKNRRGVLCRVIRSGQISRGNAIEVRESAGAVRSIGGAR